MVLIPRAAPVQAPSTATNARLGPPSRVASHGGSSVEELPEGASVSFDNGAFGFRQDAPTAFDHNGGREQQAPRHRAGGINAPSQTFAALMESSEGGNGAGNGVAAPFAGIVAKAISIYETNARIVSGENNILGRSVSLVL